MGLVGPIGLIYLLATIVNDSLVYNIPANRIDAFQGRDVIVRSASPDELVSCLSSSQKGSIRFIQLLDTPHDTTQLESVGIGVPIEIFLKSPADEFATLYSYANLLDTHPVRINIPVLPGFSPAVKLAVSLNFAVKLDMGQPDPTLIEELATVLDLYLHRSTVRQSVEFFQTTLLSFYKNEPISIWQIAEEDPSVSRYITDDGEETVAKRFAGSSLGGSVEDFVERFGSELLFEKRECVECEYFNRCSGYFKWPDKTYSCDGIRRVFQTLAEAADEVRQDLEGLEVAEVQHQL